MNIYRKMLIKKVKKDVELLVYLCYDTQGTVVRNVIDMTVAKNIFKNFKKVLAFS